MNEEIIRIRSFKPADRTAILEILTSSKVNQTYMLPDYKQKDDAIPLFLRLMELSANSHRFVRCIELNGTAIGFLNDVGIKESTIELGYAVHPAYHNRGYMTIALRLAIAELFKCGYTEVVCGAFEENKASLRVMKKCDMQQMEYSDTIEYRGTRHRCIYFCATNRKEN